MPNGTKIVMAVGFKGWIVLYSIFSAVAIVAIGVVIAETFGENSFALVVLVVALFVLGSNFAVGLMQRRDLIRSIGSILDARQVTG